MPATYYIVVVNGYRWGSYVNDVEYKIKAVNAIKVFDDVKLGKWCKQYVDYVYSYSIFDGTTAKTFSPNANITRAQFVQVLANLGGVDTSNRKVTTKFTDVPRHL